MLLLALVCLLALVAGGSAHATQCGPENAKWTCLKFKNKKFSFIQQKDTTSPLRQLLTVQSQFIVVWFKKRSRFEMEDTSGKDRTTITNEQQHAINRQRDIEESIINREADMSKVKFQACEVVKDDVAGVSEVACAGQQDKANLRIIFRHPSEISEMDWLGETIPMHSKYLSMETIIRWEEMPDLPENYNAYIEFHWVFFMPSYNQMMDLNVNKLIDRYEDNHEDETPQAFDPKHPFKHRQTSKGIVNFHFQVHGKATVFDSPKATKGVAASVHINHRSIEEMQRGYWIDSPLHEISYRMPFEAAMSLKVHNLKKVTRVLSRIKIGHGKARGGTYNAWVRYYTVFGLLIGYASFWAFFCFVFGVVYAIKYGQNHSRRSD
eukprot:Platyproteum_vivax@DN4065_c0_g1_i1.p1